MHTEFMKGHDIGIQAYKIISYKYNYSWKYFFLIWLLQIYLVFNCIKSLNPNKQICIHFAENWKSFRTCHA